MLQYLTKPLNLPTVHPLKTEPPATPSSSLLWNKKMHKSSVERNTGEQGGPNRKHLFEVNSGMRKGNDLTKVIEQSRNVPEAALA